MAFSALIVGGIGLRMFLVAGVLVEYIIDDSATVRYGMTFTRTYCITAAPYVVFAGLSGTLRGAGETQAQFYARFVGIVVMG